MRRFLPLLLICAMIMGLIPTAFATDRKPSTSPVRQEDYITADLIWDAVYAKEAEMRSKRAPLYATVEALITEVTSSPYYAEDSLIRNGDHFFWETTDGIPCGYSPRLAEQSRNAIPLPGYDAATADTVLTLSYESKRMYPASKNVYLFQPYYGLDASFTEQYVSEANNIALTLGGTATTYRTTGATIDMIADALSSGGVVIFDSHGDTDYANGEDYTSCANTSYICLQTGKGLTDEDYEIATGPFGEYYHAYYGGSYGSMRYYCVDGTAIANHMESPAPNSMLWMALCLSMATDGLHGPLRDMGVAVAYGYSQSVTFEYDYEWERVFWEEMRLGKTVAEGISAMKAEVGLWDWCHGSEYDTIAEARAKYSAFPIVVSHEDVYPGHGKVDDLQTVTSQWTLLAPCEHRNITFIPDSPPTCTEDGNIAHYLCTNCLALFRDEELTQRIHSEDTLIPATGHSYIGRVTTPSTCASDGILTYTCESCNHSYTELLPAEGHHYTDGFCTICGIEKPSVPQFEVGFSGTYILAAKVNDKYYAMPNNYTDKSGKLSGVEVNASYGFVEEANASDFAVLLTYIPETGKYTIHNGDYYLRYPSSTNLGGITSPYYWTISQGVNGSWQIISETNNRGLVYRASSYNSFGGYYRPSVIANGREYFDLEIIPIFTPGEDVPQTPPVIDESIRINHTLNLASGISINYMVMASLLEGYDTFRLHCEIPLYEEGEFRGYEPVIIEPVLKDYFYYFTLEGITAVQMGDEIRATLEMSKEGEISFSETDIYSVAEYAYGQLNKDTNTLPLKKLCAQLLRYGSCAQQFKSYRTDAPVDEAMTEEMMSYLSDLDAVTFQQNNLVLEDLPDPSVTWVGKTLNLESKVVTRFIADLNQYEGELADLRLKVNYSNYMGEDVEVFLPPPTAYMEEYGYYAFDIDCLLAAELRCVISAAVYCGETQISPTVQYSPDTYGNGKTGALLTLCKALIAYSDTALAYFK